MIFLLQGMFVGGYKVHVIAQTTAFNHAITHIGWDGNKAIKGYFNTAIINNFFLIVIHFHDVEVGNNLDVFLFQQIAQHFCCTGFCKCARHWGYVNNLHFVAHAPFCEKSIGEKHKFEWGHRTFIGQFCNVNDQVSTLPGFKIISQSHGTFNGIKIKNIFVPELVF